MFVSEVRKLKLLFATGEVVALGFAFVCALAIHDPYGSMRAWMLDNPAQVTQGWAVVATIWILVFRFLDLYRPRGGDMEEVMSIAQGSAVAALVTITLGFLIRLDISRETVVLAFALSVGWVFAVRNLLRVAVRRLYAKKEVAIPLVIVGLNRVGQYLCDQVLDESTHYSLLGFIDDSGDSAGYRGIPLYGSPALLKGLAAGHPCLEVLIALPEASAERQSALIRMCERLRIRWSIVPSLFGALASSLRVDLMGVIPVLGPRGSNIEGLNYFVKRTFDLVLGALLMLIGAPIMILAALAILLTDGRPVLFRQIRVGIHGKSFELFKFRTMRQNGNDGVHRDFVRDWIRAGQDAPQNGEDGAAVFKLTDDDRITSVGRWLRRFSIDELPQLLNVIRGEMSLIGPRPAIPYELEHYKPIHRRRLDALPGLTGLWQVSGRSRLSFEDMVRLDLQYLENWSLASDIKILVRTMPELLRGSGL